MNAAELFRQSVREVDRESFRLSVAPMMDRTDRHFRYLIRLVSPHARLYTEMITSAALLRGDAKGLLAFDPSEHPVAAQLGGSDPRALADAARLVADAGYDEVNLNCGCPSDRVQAGDFGARLMLDAGRVAECVAAMREATALPVTVKTRIGVDLHDDYEILRDLTERVVAAGVSALIVHARKAWLSGLSPKQNREVPPLDYPRVHRLKRDFPDLPVAINGGFQTESEVLDQQGQVDGVMLGRSAYQDPMLVGRLDARLWPAERLGPAEGLRPEEGLMPADGLRPAEGLPSIPEIVRQYSAYMRVEQAKGTPLHAMSRHLHGLFAHRPGARQWRRSLTEFGNAPNGIDCLLAVVTSMPGGTRYNATVRDHVTPNNKAR
jgi:tRNA-dihydrouridine synthase A